MRIIPLLLLIAAGAQAQERSLQGNITYLSAATVYTSLGRKDGVRDSTMIYVTTDPDTIAILKVIAVSSSSSACVIVRATRPFRVGDRVTAPVPPPLSPSGSTSTAAASPAPAPSPLRSRDWQPSRPSTTASIPEFRIHGRVSFQYYTALFGRAALDRTQPGVAMSLRGRASNHPVSFELYTNARALMSGSASPWSARASNQTRLYRLSLTYDTRTTRLTVGRFAPRYAPSIGFIDGVTLARRMGRLTAGTSFGFQPDRRYQRITTDYRKIMLFTRYQTAESSPSSVSLAYARTYFRSHLDRESVSGILNVSAPGRMTLYAYSDIDLRTRSGNRLALAPELSTMFASLRYRVNDGLSLGLGGDAARPLYTFTSIQSIPDSLLDTRLRAGITVNADLTLPHGFGVYTSFTPRSSEQGFGRAYSVYASMRLFNPFGKGARLRGTLVVNKGAMSTIRSYGLRVQRRITGLDVTTRYQHARYTLNRTSGSRTSETIGIDITRSLGPRFFMLMNYEYTQGYGPRGNAVFTELSRRF